MSKPDYEAYAQELAKAIRPFVESCLQLRHLIKVNLDSKNRLRWDKVETTFYKFEDELNKFLGENQ